MAYDIRQIYFVVTRRCNLFCSHCIRSSGPAIRDYLTIDFIRKAMEDLASCCPSANMIISGGEPSLHKDFLDIINVATSLFPVVTVNTNGLRKDILLAATRNRGNITVQVSIDGDEKHHNSIRGFNTFKRSLDTIQALASGGVRVIVASTISTINHQHLKLLDEELVAIPFALWTLQREVIYGRAGTQNALSTLQWNAIAHKVSHHFRNKRRIKVGTMFDFNNLSKTQKNGAQRAFMNCGTGYSKIYINPDLTVFPCGCLEEYIVGDLSKESAKKVLKRLTQLPVKLSPLSACQSCPFVAVCNGGCPGASLHKYGSFGVGDPRCPAIQNFTVI